jgi:hypothetical protein
VTISICHLYRAMAWLGEALPAELQDDATPFAPRCTKDLIEEELFAHRRDLFSRLDLVFMDTTGLYFEGLGGQTLGQYGYSKDHRPDLRQMILAVLIDGDRRPVCSEMWPGNTADVTCLVPVIDRLRRRFSIGRVCIVADRGMLGPQRASALGSRSAETIAALDQRGLLYLLGVRERTDKLVRDVVLNDAAPFVPLTKEKRGKDTDYSAKPVMLAGTRYIACINHQEAEKDAAERAAILASLERQLKRGDKALVGNTGYRRFLTTVGDGQFVIDRAKAEQGRTLRPRVRAAHQHRAQPARRDAALQAALHCRAELPHRQASARHPADLPQAGRDHPRPCVLQLPCTRAEGGAGGAHRTAGPKETIMAGDHR